MMNVNLVFLLNIPTFQATYNLYINYRIDFIVGGTFEESIKASKFTRNCNNCIL